MTPTLAPRLYKIEHDANEHVYYVSWMHEFQKWGIRFGTRPDGYFTDRYHFDYPGADTQLFDTPELALDGWKKYIKQKNTYIKQKNTCPEEDNIIDWLTSMDLID